jgi:hypothetical protein
MTISKFTDSIFRTILTTGLIVLAFSTPAMSGVRLPGVLGSGMVMQRNKPIKIWGWADRGEKVTASFNGLAMTAPDPANWMFDVGGHGFGNHQLEYDTARPENAIIHEGNLVITARKETYTGPDGVTRDYTSARLKSEKLYTQQYGRLEARR